MPKEEYLTANIGIIGRNNISQYDFITGLSVGINFE
jgi:hypothetical protein